MENMITYKIEGLDTMFKSKPENFDRDVLRWKQRNSLRFAAEVTILENDEQPLPEPTVDSTVTGDTDQLKPVSKKSRNSKRVYLVESTEEAIDLQPVHDVLDEPTVPTDESGDNPDYHVDIDTVSA